MVVRLVDAQPASGKEKVVETPSPVPTARAAPSRQPVDRVKKQTASNLKVDTARQHRPAPAEAEVPVSLAETVQAPSLPKDKTPPETSEPFPATEAVAMAIESEIVPGRQDAGSEGGAAIGQSAPMEAIFGTENGPKILRMVQPIYPLRARRLRKEGRVVLRLHLDSIGNVRETEVVESAGLGFDAAALDAMKKSKFLPAIKDGRPAACLALLPVRFALQASR